MMQPLIIADSAIAAVSLFLGAVIVFREPKNATYQSFFVFAVGIAVSAFAKSFFWGQGDFFARAAAKGGFDLMILGTFLALSIGSGGKVRGWFALVLIPWAAAFLALPAILAAAAFDPDPAAFFWQAYHGLAPVTAFVMSGYLLLGVAGYLRRRRSAGSSFEFLTRGLVVVMFAAALMMCVADLILPLLGVTRFTAVSNFFSLVVVIIGGYGMVRYGSYGSALLRRVVMYFLSLTSVALLFFGAEFAIEKFFYQNDRPADILAAVIGVLAFLPLRDLFNAATDRLFFRNSYPFFAAMKELGRRLDAPLHRGDLLGILEDFLRLTVRPTETVFFEVRRESGAPVLISGLPFGSAAANDYARLAERFLMLRSLGTLGTDAVRFFSSVRSVKNEDLREEIERSAARLGVGAVMPISIKSKIRMLIFLGRKRSGALFSRDDLAFLDFIAERAGVALETIELREDMDVQVQKFRACAAEQAEKIKAITETQSHFLTDVSHEFKTPLVILKMHAGTFSRSNDAEQKQAWRIMDATLDRLMRLVGGFLDMAKQGPGGSDSAHGRVELDALVRDICEDCAILAEDKGVALRWSGHEPVSVSGNADQLREVVMNLLSNALRHTPQGGSISLDVRAVDGAAEVSVADTGSGIAEENLGRIFERFYRVEGGRSEDDGSGIGLYLCQQIARNHSGTIMAESAPGRGSRFILRLPTDTAVQGHSRKTFVSVTRSLPENSSPQSVV